MVMFRKYKNTEQKNEVSPAVAGETQNQEAIDGISPDKDLTAEFESFEEEESEYEEDRAAEIFNDDEKQYLWCYVNQVSLQGRLYFKDEIKIDDTTISNRVASFNLLIKKNTKNGVKRHRIYVKTYNKDIIEWLMQQEVGTWVKVEGRLEAASNKTYVNATSITAFSEERMKAIFENYKNDEYELPNVDWRDYDKRNEPELNKKAIQKLKQLRHQARQLTVNTNSVYVTDDDTPVAAAASSGSLTEDDISEITAKTRDLVASYRAYLAGFDEDDDDEDEYDGSPMIRKPPYMTMRKVSVPPLSDMNNYASDQNDSDYKSYDTDLKEIKTQFNDFDFSDLTENEPIDIDQTDDLSETEEDTEQEEKNFYDTAENNIPTEALRHEATLSEEEIQSDFILPPGARLVKTEPLVQRSSSRRFERRSFRRR